MLFDFFFSLVIVTAYLGQQEDAALRPSLMHLSSGWMRPAILKKKKGENWKWLKAPYKADWFHGTVTERLWLSTIMRSVTYCFTVSYRFAVILNRSVWQTRQPKWYGSKSKTRRLRWLIEKAPWNSTSKKKKKSSDYRYLSCKKKKNRGKNLHIYATFSFSSQSKWSQQQYYQSSLYERRRRRWEAISKMSRLRGADCVCVCECVCMCFVEGGGVYSICPPAPLKEPSRTLWPNRPPLFLLNFSFVCF